MARPPRNNVDYFPFYCKEGRAMFYIEEKYGNDGYASWIKILRQLAVTNFHYLNLSDDIDSMYLAAKCKISEETLSNIITDLSKLGEFNMKLWSENKVVYSEKFIESIEDAYSKRNNKLHTLASLREHLQGLGVLKPSKPTSKGGDNTQSIVEYNKEDNKRVKKSIEEREKEFRLTANNFNNLFDSLMINRFCDYWTEPNKSNTKMKFELNKTFDIKRRLTTWNNNNFGNSAPAQKLTGSFANNTTFEDKL